MSITGELVDGVKQIEEANARAPLPKEMQPQMAMAGKGGKGKISGKGGKKVAVRR